MPATWPASTPHWLLGRLATAGAPARVLATAADGTVRPMVMTLGLLPAARDAAEGAAAVLRPADTGPVTCA